MNDLTVSLDITPAVENPYTAVFAIEQELFARGKKRALDALEKGQIKFQYKQSFNPHERLIRSMTLRDEDDTYLIVGGLINLTGATGILPSHYSETVARTLRDKDTVLKDFLNIFNHRLSSLMYRSWGKYRLDVDRVYQTNVEQYRSAIDLMMTSLAGQPYPSDDSSVAYFNGLSFATTQSASKLKNIIEEVSGLDVAINQFQGKWIELEESDLSRMSSRLGGGQYNQLGVNTMLGRRCWDLSSGFEVEFEVNDKETFNRLTPGGDMNKKLRALLQKLVGNAFEFNFKLKVKEAHCERTKLSKHSQQSLGANAWMGNGAKNDRIIDYYC